MQIDLDIDHLTEDFYWDMECVTDEKFLEKWKDELKELREIFFGSSEGEESDEDDIIIIYSCSSLSDEDESDEDE